MTQEEVLTSIKTCPELTILETTENTVVIENQRKEHFEVDLKQASQNKHMDQFLATLKGDREAQVLQQVTRICGYFSLVSNWNKSKIAELKDRHKGNYSISGVKS